MKKLYAESTLKRKYRELGIPKEAYTKVHLYLLACANFYRALSTDDVFKVIEVNERRMGRKGEDIIEDRQLFAGVNIYAADTFIFHDEEHAFGQELSEEEEEIFEKECVKMILSGSMHYAGVIDSILFPITSEGFRYSEGDYVLSREDFERILDLREREPERYCVFSGEDIFLDYDGSERYVVSSEGIFAEKNDGDVGIDMGSLGDIINSSEGKELYVPDNILRYIDKTYYEENQSVLNMKEYLMDNYFTEGDEEDEEKVCLFILKLYNIIRRPGFEGKMDDVMETAESFGICFESIEEAGDFVELYMDMNNNTRLPGNKGKTPSELSGSDEKPRLSFLGRRPEDLEPNEEMVINSGGTVIKGRKIGPNEPCPCGSGKKYKKCCGRLH